MSVSVEWPGPISLIVLMYIVVFVLGMFGTKFRSSFLDWLTLRDMFGMAFWRKNVWLSILSFAVVVSSPVLIV